MTKIYIIIYTRFYGEFLNVGKYGKRGGKNMLGNVFKEVYMKFKLNFYKSMFEKIQNREMSLSAVETFCIEIIYAMNKPTVSEFASFIQISSPNAAYKVNSLVKKGYLVKKQSENDKREYHLEVTEKYLNYYNLSSSYIDTVTKRMEERFTEEEIKLLQKMLSVMTEELMPELDSIGRINS